jgi:hypothetical protein
MTTVNRDFMDYVLRVLDELKGGQDQIRARLSDIQYERGLPVYTTPAAGDNQWGYRDEIHGERADPRRRVEQDEPHTSHGYVERPPHEVPRRTVRFQTDDFPANQRINQHNTESPYKTGELSSGGERPRYAPSDSERSPVCPVTDQQLPSSSGQGKVGEQRCCGSCKNGQTETSAIKRRDGYRTYGRQNPLDDNIFMPERPQRRVPLTRYQ